MFLKSFLMSLLLLLYPQTLSNVAPTVMPCLFTSPSSPTPSLLPVMSCHLSPASSKWKTTSSDSPSHRADVRVSHQGWWKTIISQASLHHSPDPQGLRYVCSSSPPTPFIELKSVLSARLHNPFLWWRKIEGRLKPEGTEWYPHLRGCCYRLYNVNSMGYRQETMLQGSFVLCAKDGEYMIWKVAESISVLSTENL